VRLDTARQDALVNSPSQRVVLVLGFPDIYVAADAVPEYQRFSPIAIEGLDRAIIRGLQARKLAQAEIDLLPEGDAWVMMEFGADCVEAATAQAQGAADYFKGRPSGPVPSARLIGDPRLQRRIWSIRETGASATQLSIDPNVPDPQVGWEDAAVDPHRLGEYLRSFQAPVDRFVQSSRPRTWRSDLHRHARRCGPAGTGRPCPRRGRGRGRLHL